MVAGAARSPKQWRPQTASRHKLVALFQLHHGIPNLQSLIKHQHMLIWQMEIVYILKCLPIMMEHGRQWIGYDISKAMLGEELSM